MAGKITMSLMAACFFAIWLWSLAKGSIFESVGCLAAWNMYLEIAVKEWRS